MDLVDQLAAHVKGRDSEACHKPLVSARGAEVDVLCANVNWPGADELDGVAIEVSAVRVCEIGERLHVVAVPAVVVDPRHRNEPRPAVDELLEVLDRGGAVPALDDADLDALVSARRW